MAHPAAGRQSPRGPERDAGRPVRGRRRFRLSVPDWLPGLVNAGRAFVAIGAIELFWVLTAWPNGASAIVFSAVVVLLLSPKGDQSYAGAMAFAVGVVLGVPAAAIVKFAVLPGFSTFPAFCAGLALCLIPVGFVMAQSRQPQVLAVVSAMGFNLVPLLAPTNQMSYDTAAFYNSALAIVVGCAVAPLSFRLRLWCKRWRSSQLGAWKSPSITQRAPHSKSRERFCV